MHNDFNNFLSSIKYLDRPDVLAIVEAYNKAIEKPSTKYDKTDRMELQKNSANLLYWMEYQTCPPDMSKQDFLKFKPLAENFVKKGQLEAGAMSVFK